MCEESSLNSYELDKLVNNKQLPKLFCGVDDKVVPIVIKIIKSIVIIYLIPVYTQIVLEIFEKIK